MSEIWASLDLTTYELVALTLIVLVAAVVRGFSGFALSALVMAAGATLIPPIQLIPILWVLEMTASLQMARGGWQDANRTAALLLVLGNFIGWPLGLSLTSALPVAQSSLIALLVILVLALLQLTRLRIPGLDTKPGALATGVVAGIVSGLAHVGGMVVALYVLAQNSAARSMRGTLVIYLFVGSFGSLLYLLHFGVMTSVSAIQGLVFAPVTLLGVWLGTKFFNPRLEPYYRPFCLCLLVFLAGLGLIRMAVS